MGRGFEVALTLPNIRSVYIPDEGYVIIEGDLEQADARVVAWDANAHGLKAIFRDPSLSLHIENAKVIYGPSVTSKHDHRYKLAKAGVHATNYFCQPLKLSKVLGCTVHEAGRFQDKWFGAHPEIKAWHNRNAEELQRASAERRVPRIRNAFGYYRPYFDRVDSILPQVLAWLPQSTVGITINKGLKAIATKLRQVQLLLQEHDSLVMQMQVASMPVLLTRVAEEMKITIPYDDPLVIPVSFKASTRSWGECHEVDVKNIAPWEAGERRLLGETK